MKYLSNLNLNKNEIQNVRLQNLAASPANPVAGQIYFDTVANSAFVYNGTSWLSAAGATVVGGTLLGVTVAGQQFTVNHDAVTRSDATSAASPAFAGTFTAVDSVTTTTEGHVTAINVKTITLPTYNISAVDKAGVANIRLNSGIVDDDVALVGGTDIDIVRTDADTITVNHSDTSSATSITGLTTAAVISEVSVDGRGHVTALAQRNLTFGDIGALGAGNLTVTASTISSTDNTITLDPGTTATTGTVIIAGDLRVDGTTTTVNSTVVELGDNIIVLNSGEEGTPSADAGFEINRGTGDPASLLWNESTDRFQVTDLGGTYAIARKFVKTIVNADLDGATATITHNLNTKDITVSLREVSSDEIVYATYDAATVDTLEIKFAIAPADGAFIVTIVG
jgi:hypothetical protein